MKIPFKEPIKLIIFDLDGVLVNTQGMINQIEVEEISKYGFTFELAKFTERFCGETTEYIQRRLFQEDGIELSHRFANDVKRKVHQALEKGINPIKGVKETLPLLLLDKCVASNSKIHKLRFILEKSDLLPYFDGKVFSAEMVENPKPSPDLFLYAARACKVEPSQCVVIEDSEAGIKAARKAHMHALGFTGGNHLPPTYPQKLLELGASLIFNNMSDLPELLEIA